VRVTAAGCVRCKPLLRSVDGGGLVLPDGHGSGPVRANDCRFHGRQAAAARVRSSSLSAKRAHEKHGFRAGDVVSGVGEPVVAPEAEIADLYKVSKLVVEQRSPTDLTDQPPWLGVPPPLEVYRGRGHRRLDAKRFASSCASCMWGCEMAVEIIIDQWNPSKVRWRRETFCYGPKSCALYRAGPRRKLPGRKGMSWIEDDWIDEEATAHRGDDD